jgi:hypothetical protein
MSKYAKGTSVTVTQSHADIQSILARFGAVFDGFVKEPGREIVMFHGKLRYVHFVLWLRQPMTDQVERELWRALFLGIKGNLVNIASGIETFEQAFYAHLVTEDGKILSEKYRPALKNVPALISAK